MINMYHIITSFSINLEIIYYQITKLSWVKPESHPGGTMHSRTTHVSNEPFDIQDTLIALHRDIYLEERRRALTSRISDIDSLA